MSPLLISIAAFVGVAALVGAARCCSRESDDKVEDRLAMLTGGRAARGQGRDAQGQRAVASRWTTFAAVLRSASRAFANLGLLFEQADTHAYPARSSLPFPACWPWSAWSLAGVGGDSPRAHRAVLALVLALLPLVWLMLRRKRRFKAVRRAIARRAGADLAGPCVPGTAWPPDSTWCAKRCGRRSARNFGRVFEEQNLGIPLDDARWTA